MKIGFRKKFEEHRKLLVEMLKREGVIRSKEVEDAMLAVPREVFVPPQLADRAYEDYPLPIGFGQTISAPHMVALMTEELAPRPGDKVLEIGTGSGYQAAVLAHIVSKEPEGHVYTVERIPQLAHRAKRNLIHALGDLSSSVTVYIGDGSEGLPHFSPYDKIIVTAAAPSVPKPLVDQLAPGGRMVIPVGTRWSQVLVTIEKHPDGRIETKYGIACIFVPLIGRHGWSDPT
ncbi:MAG: protein-L-isoaspartate(D-aspartate) O-methyltransferase [Crenarchaeota archaeon]|nr:protein-L-isoaspartate(D-aspartate) O-methyltransferase [Thermoproteota archaeon]